MKLTFKKILTYASLATLLFINACGSKSTTAADASTALTATSTYSDPNTLPATTLNDLLNSNASTSANAFSLPVSQPVATTTTNTLLSSCATSPTLFSTPLASGTLGSTTTPSTCTTGNVDALWASIGNGLAYAAPALQYVLNSIPSDASASQLNQLKGLFINAIAKVALHSAQYQNNYGGVSPYGQSVNYNLNPQLNSASQYSNWNIYNQFFGN